jgi:hypothetical protein
LSWVVPLPADLSSIPNDSDSWPSSCWAYVWRFSQLRIVQFGKGYAPLNGRVLEFQAETAEQAAETASSLFRPLSPSVIGPNGIQLDPDPEPQGSNFPRQLDSGTFSDIWLTVTNTYTTGP